MTEGDPTLSLVVSRRRALTSEITEFELRHLEGAALPPFTAGAHVNLHTPSGDVRSYSLTNDPMEAHRYVIAIKRIEGGRGGSISLTDHVSEGRILEVSRPRNTFPLVAAPRLLFIAGGIGITPLLSMTRVLSRQGHPDYRIVYCTRRKEHTAYLAELPSLMPAGGLIVHHSHAGRMDFWPFLETPDDTHIYCCGPATLMNEVRALTVHWPPAAFHFEDFSGVAGVGGDSRPFRARRSATREIFDVPAGETILDVLHAQGIDWPSSCESGTCGTCRMRVVSGNVEHRDLYLTEAEREDFMMPCVSRAADEEVELDF